MPELNARPARRSPSVAILTSVHDPFDPRVFHKQARTLAGAGYRVTLLAPGGGDRVVDGVRVWGVPAPRTRAGRPLVWLRLLGRALRLHADVYHFHDPELLPLGWLLARLTGRPVVYDAHEYYRDEIATRPWIPPALRRLAAEAVYAVESFVARRIAAVVAVNEHMAAGFRQRGAARVVAVHNYPPLAYFPAIDGDSLGQPANPAGPPSTAGLQTPDRGQGVGQLAQPEELPSSPLSQHWDPARPGRRPTGHRGPPSVGIKGSPRTFKEGPRRPPNGAGGVRATAASSRPVAAYVGLLTPDRGLATVWQAGRRLRDLAPGAEVRVIGRVDWSEAPAGIPRELVRWEGEAATRFLGVIPATEVPAALAEAAVGWIPFQRTPNNVRTIPLKLLEYMAAGKPVVASDFGFIAAIVRGAGCGLLVPAADAEAHALALARLLTHPDEARAMGERGRTAVVERYSWEAESARLLALYRDLGLRSP